MSEFIRENRYIVIKTKDVGQLSGVSKIQLSDILREIRELRKMRGSDPEKEYVCVSEDFPMYEETWKAIERYSVSGAYTSIQRENDELNTLLQERETESAALKVMVNELRELIATASVSSGYCCCGEAIDHHPLAYNCGHEPVDEWDYVKDCVLVETPAQSLADHDMRVAEKVREAIAEAFDYSHNDDNDSDIAAEFIRNIDLSEVIKDE